MTSYSMHGVSVDSSEPLLEMDRVQVEQQHHRRVEDDQDEQDGLHVHAGGGGEGPGGRDQHQRVVEVLVDKGVVRSSRRGRGAGPSGVRRVRGVEVILPPAVNPTDKHKICKKEVKIRKEMDYSLGCWSLWWKRMEREGVKEGMARRAKYMQHPISKFMRGGCSERISIIAKKLETHTRTETVRVRTLLPNVCQKTTPQKRKCHMRMKPESTQSQSDVCSPAKKQKLNSLINFWGGGAKIKGQFMNDHDNSTTTTILLSSLATTHNTETHARQMSYSGDNPVGGGTGDE